MYNYEYEISGRLVISKLGDERTFESHGELTLLDRLQPMIHFTFEEIVPLDSRQVIGLGESVNAKRLPTVQSVTVEGIECNQSIPNIGAFGKSYDAQVANIRLIDGVHGLAAEFNENSRAALWSMGPHSGTDVISFSMWFMTQSPSTTTIISYEPCWNNGDTVMNVMLNYGLPEVVYSDTQKLCMKGTISRVYNDGRWHHIAISMPKSNIALSELQVFVDGNELPMKLVGDDTTIIFSNGGMLALGGVGHGGTCGTNVGLNRDGFRSGVSFKGRIDDVFVWSHSLTSDSIQQLSTRPDTVSLQSKASLEPNVAFCIGSDIRLNKCNKSKWQQWQFDSDGHVHHANYYNKCLTVDGSRVVLMDCDSDGYDFRWRTSPNGIITFLSKPFLVMTVHGEGKSEEIILAPLDESINQKWDIIIDRKSEAASTPTRSKKCIDTESTFVMNNGVSSTCNKPRNYPAVCWRNMYQKMCPVACHTCHYTSI